MYETRAYDNEHGNPVAVLVASGTHDVSRLVQMLNRGNAEQCGVGEQLVRQVRRHNGGRAALALLKAHGGPDFTEPEPERPYIVVDIVLLGTRKPAESVHGEQLHVLMIRRKHEPFEGRRALPGGHVDPGETFEQAAYRELAEETGITVKSLRFVGLYDAPGRDPRGRYVSAVYTAYMPTLTEPTAGSDALGAGWVSVDELLTRGRIAFDHEQIIRDVLDLQR